MDFKIQVEAAQLAAREERFLEAGKLYLSINQPYEAAVNFQKGKALKECLDALLKVTRTSVSYRAACVHAVRVAGMLGEPLVRLGPMVQSFIDSSPNSHAEATAMKELAQSKTPHDASIIYRRILASYPQDEEAQDALAAIQRKSDSQAPFPSAPAAATPAARMAAVRSHGKRFIDVLIAKNKLTPARLSQVLSVQKDLEHNDLGLGEALVADGTVSELDVVKALAEATGSPYISGDKLINTTAPEALKLLTADKCERFKVCPISLVDRTLYVAMRDPRDLQVTDQVRFASGHPIKGVFATETAIRKAIQKHYYGESVADIGQEDWRSWDQMPMVSVSRFSDRFTKTREHEFDTDEMIARMSVETTPEEPTAAPPKAPEPQPPPAAAPGKHSLNAPTLESLKPLVVGSTVAGRYKLESMLGQGGSATVFKAHDMELDEKVAMKLFAPSARSESQVARYKNELSLSRQLTHPNIIRLFDLGSHDGWRYLTMELLEGIDLATKIEKTKGPLPLVEGLIVLEGACAGLQYAHMQGIIHRDIKPGNLFITNEGVVKVMDFGIAKKERVQHITTEGTIAGTPEYMSPEQISGFSNVNHLTDIYAMGCTAYTAFTGGPPFTNNEVMAILMAQVNNTPPSIRAKNGTVPLELEQLVNQLLEKEPEKRIQSCEEIGAQFKRIRTQLMK